MATFGLSTILSTSPRPTKFPWLRVFVPLLRHPSEDFAVHPRPAIHLRTCVRRSSGAALCACLRPVSIFCPLLHLLEVLVRNVCRSYRMESWRSSSSMCF